MKRLSRYVAACFLLVCSVIAVPAQKKQKPVSPVTAGKNGKLTYQPDSLGNRIPDFSYCGYAASEKPIPEVAVKITVPLVKGDATLRIQSAIDYLASLPMDNDGFRGAVLLEKGKYEVSGQIRINASGIVLRGSGANGNGTQLMAMSTDRRTLIRIAGKNNRKTGNTIAITDSYVPVNATSFNISSAGSLNAGDHILIRRPSTKEWIEEIGADHFGGGITALGWKAGERDLLFDRTITSINHNNITIDAPITTAIDANYGGGTIGVYEWSGKICNIGVEGIECISSYDINNAKDEAHSWMAITMENVSDAWVRQMRFEHFAGSAVNLLETTRRITVEDCISLSPVSEIGGQRRYTFLTTGQQTLFQRCYAEYGYHDFATGYCAAGPNAFVQCESHLPYNFSGAINSWSSGILFDVVSVDGNALRFGNRGQDGQGAGWAAANSLFWNCSAARIDCYRPPTAQNWAFGSWAQFSGDGYWEASNNSINPRSFFYAQLADRLNKNVDAQARLLKVETEASSSPTVEAATMLTAEAAKPKLQLREWIEQASQRTPLNIQSKGTKTADAIGIEHPVLPAMSPVMHIENGWIVRGKTLLTGRRQEVPWWNGGVEANDLANAQPAITRFVPGRTGKGHTDDLDQLTDTMRAKNIIGMEQHYGLWYERRRDDHERIRRMDGEVWPPFYELPFARSGKDTAWDGLSKYDLTRYNKWYWSRLKQFADLADQKGLLLVHEQYFQHNIIEAGAHYADFPWRTANNINHTGFPEPVPYAGDKRIFLAEQFYDINEPVRRALHVKYIRQCLNNFIDNNGVIQLTGEEFTGPLHFVKFWLETVRDWEKETGKKQIIGISATKDVQDAILSNAAYASIVDLIDIRYWHYQADGSAYAPQGGQNLAPRQHARLLKPKKTSFEQVYRAVKEYRDKFPAKAVIYSSDSFDQFGWAVLMAGGSLPVVPVLPAQFLADAVSMKPAASEGQYILTANNKDFIVYAAQSTIRLNASAGDYLVKWIDVRSGTQIGNDQKLTAAALQNLQTPRKGEVVAWIKHQ